MNPSRPAPLLASAPIRQPSNTLIRAVTARALAASGASHHSRDPLALAAAAWPRDERVVHVIRAATVGATTSTAGWADTLAGTAVSGFVSGLVPQSAAARLMQEGVRVSLEGYGRVTIPRASTSPEPVFVGEGAPIPVSQGVIANATVGPPCKLALIESLSADLAEHSPEEAETIFGVLMREAASVALDKAVFSTTAASAIRPAGILNGVTPLTATAGGGQAALLGDLGALVGALTTAGGGARVMIFAPPAKAAVLPIYAPGYGIEVVPTPALAPSTIVALDPQAFAYGFGADPTIDIASEATLHYEGAAPLDISTGSPGSAVLATPTRSLFQTYTLALRLILRCAWAIRAPGLVQFVPSVTW
jgi:hypothetical protein